jgi:shikimate 5-dehydrogenase
MLSMTVAMIREKTVVPVIIHIQPRSQNLEMMWREAPKKGGRVSMVSDDYIETVCAALRSAPDYVTVDLYAEDSFLDLLVKQLKGSTKFIAYCSAIEDEIDSSWSGEHKFWVNLFTRADKFGFDFVRCVLPSKFYNHTLEVESMRINVWNRLGKGSKSIPLTLYTTGESGFQNCFRHPVLVPVTHPSLEAFEDMWTGCDRPIDTAIDLSEKWFSSSVGENFVGQRYFVFGANTVYSLSPEMHEAGYEALSLPHSYVPIEAKEISVLTHDFAPSRGFGGSAIAHPYKVAIVGHLMSLSDHARALGAVNTVIPIREPRHPSEKDLDLLCTRAVRGTYLGLHGDNTDWIGIRALILRGLAPATAVNQDTAALVIGAGGMARAAIYAMLQIGIRNITIYNRTEANARNVIAHFRKLLDDGYSFLSGIKTAEVTFSIIDLSSPWPVESRPLPTVSVSCIPTHRIDQNPSPDFVMPDGWLQAPHGGVVIEVSFLPALDQKPLN